MGQHPAGEGPPLPQGDLQRPQLQVHPYLDEQHPGHRAQREVRKEQGLGAQQLGASGRSDAFRGCGRQADVDQVREPVGAKLHVCQSQDMMKQDLRIQSRIGSYAKSRGEFKAVWCILISLVQNKCHPC